MANLRLDAAYTAQIKAIRAKVQAYTSARFIAGQFRDADLERFIAQVVPVVLAGRRQVSALTDSYLAQVMSSQLGKRVAPRGPIDTNALRGVDAKEVYARPFITVRSKLSEGKTFDAAVSAGSARLTDILLTDMQMAKTYTAQNVMESAPSGFQYYERTLTGSKNCALCTIASTQHYTRGDLMPIHPGCDCGIQPLPPSTKRFTARDGGKRVIDPKLLDLTHDQIENALGAYDTGGRAPDYRKLIVTHQHGEIGPVLSLKGQKFTGPKAIK